MGISETSYRRQRIEEQLLNINDKGCGNCGMGTVNIEFFVHCSLDNQHVYDPDHHCDRYCKDVRVGLMQGVI